MGNCPSLDEMKVIATFISLMSGCIVCPAISHFLCHFVGVVIVQYENNSWRRSLKQYSVDYNYCNAKRQFTRKRLTKKKGILTEQ